MGEKVTQQYIEDISGCLLQIFILGIGLITVVRLLTWFVDFLF